MSIHINPFSLTPNHLYSSAYTHHHCRCYFLYSLYPNHKLFEAQRLSQQDESGSALCILSWRVLVRLHFLSSVCHKLYGLSLSSSLPLIALMPPQLRPRGLPIMLPLFSLFSDSPLLLQNEYRLIVSTSFSIAFSLAFLSLLAGRPAYWGTYSHVLIFRIVALFCTFPLSSFMSSVSAYTFS